MTEFDTVYLDTSDSTGLALWQVTNAWQRQIRAALVRHGLTHVQFVLLTSLTWMDRSAPVTQRMLAEFAGTDIMMTSQVIRALEEKGYVTRNPHLLDKRAIAVVPTPDGIALANRANVDVEAADRTYFSPLSRETLIDFTKSLHMLQERSAPAEIRTADE